MNIILDLDGTLIDSSQGKEPIIYPRPFLKEFLYYVFDKFDNVCIWTHSCQLWYDYVFRVVLSKCIPFGKKFSFVFVREENYKMFVPMPKPLQYVYELYPDTYNNLNTFIIDDMPATYMYNEQNAIPITTYYKENFLTDNALKHIMDYFESLFNC